MTAKEVTEYLTNECNPDAIVLMDVEASALYEEVSSIGELSPTQREFLNAHHADDKDFIVFHDSLSSYFKGDPDD